MTVNTDTHTSSIEITSLGVLGLGILMAIAWYNWIPRHVIWYLAVLTVGIGIGMSIYDVVNSHRGRGPDETADCSHGCLEPDGGIDRTGRLAVDDDSISAKVSSDGVVHARARFTVECPNCDDGHEITFDSIQKSVMCQGGCGTRWRLEI